MTISTNIHLLRPLSTIQAYIPSPCGPDLSFSRWWRCYKSRGSFPVYLASEVQKRSNGPVPGQNLATKVRKSCAISPYVPGVNPPEWSLISALAGSAGAPHGKTNGGANEGVSRASHLLCFSCDIFALRSNQLNAWKTLTLSSVTTLREIVTNNVHCRKTNEDWLKD